MTRKIFGVILLVVALAGFSQAGMAEGPTAMYSNGAAISWTKLSGAVACTTDMYTTQGYHWLRLFVEAADSSSQGTDSVNVVAYLREVVSRSNPDSLKNHTFSPDSAGEAAAGTAGTKSYIGAVYRLNYTNGDTLRVALPRVDVQAMKCVRLVFLGSTSNIHPFVRVRYMLYNER